MPKLNTQLIELPANHLLDKFGSGMHAPGSGSAAALMGLLAAKLLVTVATLTEQKAKYREVHASMAAIREIVQDGISPRLLELFQKDAESFDRVIEARRRRDGTSDATERRPHAEAALQALREATDILFEIAELCMRLIDHGVTIFDSGFQSARGDTGAAVSASVAAVMSAIFIINLNLKSFRGSDWAREQRKRCDELQYLVVQKQSSAFERVTTLRTEQVQSMTLDFGSEAS